MKLYTEKQLIQAFKSGMNACMKHKDWALAINYPNKIELLEYMQSLTPIELPSDEEIWKWTKMQSLNEPTGAEEFGRVYGAKWMRDKIQGGNNED